MVHADGDARPPAADHESEDAQRDLAVARQGREERGQARIHVRVALALLPGALRVQGDEALERGRHLVVGDEADLAAGLGAAGAAFRLSPLRAAGERSAR